MHGAAIELTGQRSKNRTVTPQRAALRRVQHAAGSPFLRDRLCTHPSRVRGIESLDEAASQLACLAREPIPMALLQELLKRNVWLAEYVGRLHGPLHLVEEILRALLQLPVKQRPVSSAGIERSLPRLMQKVKRIGSLSVDEFRPELDGSARVGLTARPDAAADTIPGFEE